MNMNMDMDIEHEHETCFFGFVKSREKKYTTSPNHNAALLGYGQLHELRAMNMNMNMNMNIEHEHRHRT
jgi:hypothetical protein